MTAKTTYAKTKPPARRGRGFRTVSSMLEGQISKAGQARGFAVMRLLTQWEAIVGPEIAKIAQPVTIGYSRDGFGATLTVLTTGAQAPLLQMQLPEIRTRVNACYGYAAVSRVRITQTAPAGFHEGRAEFLPKAHGKDTLSPQAVESSKALTEGVGDDRLRDALRRLGTNVITNTTSK